MESVRFGKLLPALIIGVGLLLPTGMPLQAKTHYKAPHKGKKLKAKKFKAKKFKAKNFKATKFKAKNYKAKKYKASKYKPKKVKYKAATGYR
jgi:hypothetical protein